MVIKTHGLGSGSGFAPMGVGAIFHINLFLHRLAFFVHLTHCHPFATNSTNTQVESTLYLDELSVRGLARVWLRGGWPILFIDGDHQELACYRDPMLYIHIQYA
jgi:hypothetical protein